MGTKLSNAANIGTFFLTIAIIWLMVHPSSSDPSSHHGWWSMVGAWIMPSLLTAALVGAGILNFLAHRNSISGPAATAGQGKPKWQKIQWANAERERLETENTQLKQAIKQHEFEMGRARDIRNQVETELRELKSKQTVSGEPLERFRNPQWEIVDDHTYMNATVELDGKKFSRCKFENVTLMFHGKAPVEFVAGNELKPPLSLASDHPAAILFANLMQAFRKGSQALGKITSESLVDSRGKPFPDNFSFSVGSSQQIATTTLTPSLRTRTIAMADRLKDFAVNNPKTYPSRELGESEDDFGIRMLTSGINFSKQLTAKFCIELEQELRNLNNEIQAAYGNFDGLVLEIQKAGRVCDHELLEEMRNGLWKIAQQMEK